MILKLPFYFEATQKNNNDGFPQTFIFDVKFDEKLRMFYQKPSKSLSSLLNKAYLAGTMLSGGMNDAYIGNSRIKSALEFIKKNIKTKKGSTVLEIGCGEGQILKLLAGLGFDCTGLEPGPQIKALGSLKIKMIRDFFPSKKIKKKYDVIMHFGVIEHITNPVKFLANQSKLLNDNGEIICGFPNCEPDLREGDISLFLHEHYNYFSKDSFIQVAKLAGFSVDAIEESPAGGMIHAKLSKKNTRAGDSFKFTHTSSQEFIRKSKKLKKAVKNFFKGVNYEDVAIYCPLRCMNLLHDLGISTCRLIDDNPSLHNKYLPTFKTRIENISQLKKAPPKKILIYSRTYDKVIKKKLKDLKEFKMTEIRSISEIK